MKLLLLFLVALGSIGCEALTDKTFDELDLNLQSVVTHCRTCHSTKEMQRGPLLEGLEKWYMQDTIRRFKADLRGVHPEDAQGMLMRAAVKDVPEQDLLQAVEWFAAQERPVIKAYIRGDSEKGAALYKERCYGCHDSTMGKFFSKSPDLYKLEDWHLLSQLRAFKNGWRGTVPGDERGASMQAAVKDMSDDQFKDITAYLAKFQEKPE